MNQDQISPSSISHLNFHYYNSSATQSINVVSPISPNFSNAYFNNQIPPNQQFQFVVRNQLTNQLPSQPPIQLPNQIASQISTQISNTLHNQPPTQQHTSIPNSNTLHGPHSNISQNQHSSTIVVDNNNNNMDSSSNSNANFSQTSQQPEQKKRKPSVSKKHKKDAASKSNPSPIIPETSTSSISSSSAKKSPKEKDEKPRVSRDDPKEARLQEAMRLVQEGKFSRRKAAAQTGISPNTLKRRLNGSVSREEYLERTKKISALEEFVLECVLVALVSQGAVIKPAALRAIVALYLNHRNTVPGIVKETTIARYTPETESLNRYYDTMLQNKNLLLQIEQLEEEVQKLKKEIGSNQKPSSNSATEKSNDSLPTTAIPATTSPSEVTIEEFNSIPKGWCSRFLKRSKFLELVNGNVSVEKSVGDFTETKENKSSPNQLDEEEDYHNSDEDKPTTNLQLLQGYNIPCHPNDKEKFAKTCIFTKSQQNSFQNLRSSSALSSHVSAPIKQEPQDEAQDLKSDNYLLQLLDITSSPEFAELQQHLREFSSKHPDKNLDKAMENNLVIDENALGAANVPPAAMAPVYSVMRVIQSIVKGPLGDKAKTEFYAQENKMKFIYNQTVNSISAALTSSYNMLQLLVLSRISPLRAADKPMDETSNGDDTNGNIAVAYEPSKMDSVMPNKVGSSNGSQDHAPIVCLPVSGSFRSVSLSNQPSANDNIMSQTQNLDQYQNNQAQPQHFQHLQQIPHVNNTTAIVSTTKRIVTPPDNIISYINNSNIQFPVTPNTPKSNYTLKNRGNHGKFHSFTFGCRVNGASVYNPGVANTNNSIPHINGISSINDMNVSSVSSVDFGAVNSTDNVSDYSNLRSVNLNNKYENVFKVNLRPSQQQQAQQPLKMVIETGIKSPKKRKRVASTLKEEKDEMEDKRQKVSDGGDDAASLPTGFGEGKDNSSNHSHHPSSESDFSPNTGSHVSNSPVESPNLATGNSTHASAMYSASNLDTDISAHSGSKMDLDLKVLDNSSGNDMCDGSSQQRLAGPGETAASVHVDSKMEISDVEHMNSSNVTASSISSSSPSSVSTTVSSSVIASIADSSVAVGRAKFKTDIQAYPTLASNMLADVTNINLGGNMSEYVNFEYDYEDEFQ